MIPKSGGREKPQHGAGPPDATHRVSFVLLLTFARIVSIPLLEILVPMLIQLPASVLYDHWQATLPILAARTRAALLHDLRILLPVIVHLA